MPKPLTYTWTGEAMVPLPRFADAAARRYVDGENYQLEECEDASDESRGHYFAKIKKAHDNLPEVLKDQFPTRRRLRKWALVRAGYRKETQFVCVSAAEARWFASRLRGTECFVYIEDCVVVHCVAESQSKLEMGGRRFNESKQKVLEVLAHLIGVSVDELAEVERPPLQRRVKEIA